MTERPEKLNDWFRMAMKEMQRSGYIDLAEEWGIAEDELEAVETYIENVFNIIL